MKNRIFFLIINAIIITSCFAETLPLYHPVYLYIDELQFRGYCLDLLSMNRPYTRQEVAHSLGSLHAKNMIKQDIFIEQLAQPLFTEFSEELSGNIISDNIYFQSFVQGNFDHSDDAINYKGVYRGGFGAHIGKNFNIFSGVNFNQYDYDNPQYTGFKWRGITGYMEQAYIEYQTRRFTVKFGRDFINWGPGKNGSLIMSAITIPLDQLYAAVNFGPFRFSYFASELDDLYTKKINSMKIPVKRYLSGHRLDARFWQNRIQIGISELMLYGGDAENFSMIYLNPVMFYHGEHKNGASSLGNVLPSVDFLIYPLKNWNIYSSLLIDDYQIDNSVVDDLEPNEFGFILGTTWADPLQRKGLDLNLEYTRVTNRTYKTPDPVETFIYRGITLGHPLGNDFDRIFAGASQWVRPDLFVNINFIHTRHGEGSMFTPWDEPWKNFTVEQGYSEPFPTGIVETENCFQLKMRWYYSDFFRIGLSLNSFQIENENNIDGKKHSYLEGRFNLEFDVLQKWNIMDLQ